MRRFVNCGPRAARGREKVMRGQEDSAPEKASALWGGRGDSSGIAGTKRARIVLAALVLVVALTAPSAALAKPTKGGLDLVANWTE